MHGDRVVVRIERVKSDGRVEGRIIRILERGNTWLVGRYDRDEQGMGFVVPFDRRVLMDILVPPGQEGGASPGEMVTVELTRWPTGDARRDRTRRRGARQHRCAWRRHRDHHPQVRHSGRPFERRDRGGDPPRYGGLRPRHSRSHRLPRPARPSRSTASTPATSTTRSRSRSCRTATTGSACTSPTCRTTCARAAPSTAKAYQRGTSVYFPERAVHMFPSELATGLCSLNPHVDRLVQSCFMEVDRRGEVVRARVPRRRDQQQRADDLHRRERHPDRPRSRTAGAVRAARADVRADGRAVSRS